MKLLALDLSTKSTGYALFDKQTGDLLDYGCVKPGKIPGISKMKYPERAYYRMMSVADAVKDVVAALEPDEIVIEEINRGINRIGQKTLDALHFFVLDRLMLLDDQWLKFVSYVDSNGATGWRGKLGINTKKYKGMKKSRSQKWKKAAEEYVNENYGTDFDVWEDESQADICDAVALGCAFLK